VYTIRDRLLRKGDYIYGSFLKPEVVDGYINGINPGDRADVLGRFPFSEQDVDDAIEYASQGARIWRRVPAPERAAALYRLREALLHLQEHLAILISRENGKPFWEARQEVDATVRLLDVLMEDGVGMLASMVVDEVGARMDRLPRGVVAILTPYNMPLLVPVSHSAMAILAGNSVVLKPSKFTPGVGQAVADLWDRCRLPRGVFNMVQRLVVHPGIDMLLFTGSFETAMSGAPSSIGPSCRPSTSVVVRASPSSSRTPISSTRPTRCWWAPSSPPGSATTARAACWWWSRSTTPSSSGCAPRPGG
jgi:acyl-CoA reductase-like NAD-dependent aldehyde dehydrogenase